MSDFILGECVACVVYYLHDDDNDTTATNSTDMTDTAAASPSTDNYTQDDYGDNKNANDTERNGNGSVLVLIFGVVILLFSIACVVIPYSCSTIRRPRIERQNLELERKRIDGLLVTKPVRPHQPRHHHEQNHRCDDQSSCHRGKKHYPPSSAFKKLTRNNKKKDNNDHTTDNSTRAKAVEADKEESLVAALDYHDDYDTTDSITIPPCYICLESFQVGDMVSWSENTKCCHVFHHDCIMTWLLRKHDNCPCCRQRYIKRDRSRNNDRFDDYIMSPSYHFYYHGHDSSLSERNNDIEEETSISGSVRGRATFCVLHGLVLASTSSKDDDDNGGGDDGDGGRHQNMRQQNSSLPEDAGDDQLDSVAICDMVPSSNQILVHDDDDDTYNGCSADNKRFSRWSSTNGRILTRFADSSSCSERNGGNLEPYREPHWDAGTCYGDVAESTLFGTHDNDDTMSDHAGTIIKRRMRNITPAEKESIVVAVEEGRIKSDGVSLDEESGLPPPPPPPPFAGPMFQTEKEQDGSSGRTFFVQAADSMCSTERRDGGLWRSCSFNGLSKHQIRHHCVPKGSGSLRSQQTV